jgi:Tfp pilus assembly protein PilF
VGIACIANVAAMTGRLAESEHLLATALARSGDTDLQPWVLTLLAEMATRRGDAATAEARYRQALALDGRDSYLLGAYADFLLDQKRAPEVVQLLGEHTRIDGLLLRYALAQQQTPGRAAARATAIATAELAARFAAAMLRGDAVHQREQARFELHLRGDAKSALALARQNWAVQKESADMRILLEAAVKAGDKDAAALVLDWVRTNGTQDVAIARLARQLEEEA